MAMGLIVVEVSHSHEFLQRPPMFSRRDATGFRLTIARAKRYVHEIIPEAKAHP
jgi:hypothetical protein